MGQHWFIHLPPWGLELQFQQFCVSVMNVSVSILFDAKPRWSHKYRVVFASFLSFSPVKWLFKMQNGLINIVSYLLLICDSHLLSVYSNYNTYRLLLKIDFEIIYMSMSSLALTIFLTLEMKKVFVFPTRKEEVANLVQSNTKLFNKKNSPLCTNKIIHSHH